jgi:anti-repressor protein
MTTTALERAVHVDFSGDAPMISARELHDALEIQTVFRQWFPRMLKYGFQEGSDYVKVLQKSEGSRTGQTEIDYLVSVDMAKHICMIQRTKKGMMYRQYFLELEKAWNTPEKVMARALQIANRQIKDLQTRCFLLTTEAKRQERLLAEIKPKADYLDRILHSKALVLTTQIAKDYGMSTVRFNHLLADLGIQYKVREQWVLYAQYQDQGYTASKCFEVPQADGSLLVKYQTEWTQKGQRFLYLFLKEKGILPVLEQQLYDAAKAR